MSRPGEKGVFDSAKSGVVATKGLARRSREPDRMLWTGSASAGARRPRPARRPGLEALEARQLLAANLSNPSFDGTIGAAVVRSTYGVDGSGLAAAVIDTGVDYNHPALGGGFGPGTKVEGGYDFAMGDADPRAETWSHGTMVASLIASNSAEAPGVAPGADIVALRVFGNDNQGDFDSIANALQYVVDHHAEQKISVVNLSLSDGGNYRSNPFALAPFGSRISSLISQLRDLRIPVVAASGNSFNGTDQGMGYLAIIPKTLSVTASNGSDGLLGDAQRLSSGASATDLAAPGANLRTASDNGGYAQVSGTSFAAPLVSGAVVLLQSIYQSRFGTLPTVDQIETWLARGSTPIQDPVTGATFPRLDVQKAAALIPAAPAASPTPTPTPAPGATPVSPPTTVATTPPAAPSTPTPVQPPVVVAVQPPAPSLTSTPAPSPAPAPPPIPAPTPTVATIAVAPAVSNPATPTAESTGNVVLTVSNPASVAAAAAPAPAVTPVTVSIPTRVTVAARPTAMTVLFDPVRITPTATPAPSPATAVATSPPPAVTTSVVSNADLASLNATAAVSTLASPPRGPIARSLVHAPAAQAATSTREVRAQGLANRAEVRAGRLQRWTEWLSGRRPAEAASRPVAVARAGGQARPGRTTA